MERLGALDIVFLVYVDHCPKPKPGVYLLSPTVELEAKFGSSKDLAVIGKSLASTGT